MKNYLLLALIAISSFDLLSAQVQVNKDDYYRIPSEMVYNGSSKVYTRAIFPLSDCAVLTYNKINIYWELVNMDNFWGVEFIFENKTDQNLYVNFRQATAIVNDTSARLFYGTYRDQEILKSYAIQVLPHTISPILYVRPDYYIGFSGLYYDAKRSKMGISKKPYFITFFIPVVDSDDREETYEIKFEVMGVTKKWLKQNDFLLPSKWGEYYPRAAYEALQNRPIPE